MARSDAATVQEYLDELPQDRRTVISRLRDLINENLPRGYVEAMRNGMITYEIPLERYPYTYNGQPLAYVALAAQKNYYALYLVSAYQDQGQVSQLRDAFKKADKKLDMGKSCIRFRSLEDLPLDVIAKAISGTSVAEFIERYEAGRSEKSREVT